MLTREFEAKFTIGRNIKRMILSSKNNFLSFSHVKNAERRGGGKVWPMKRCNSEETKFLHLHFIWTQKYHNETKITTSSLMKWNCWVKKSSAPIWKVKESDCRSFISDSKNFVHWTFEIITKQWIKKLYTTQKNKVVFSNFWLLSQVSNVDG